MKLEAKKLLFDVMQACRDVERFTAGKAFNDYLEDGMLRAAVERKFEVIGEALVRLRARDQETFQRISAGQRAIAFLWETDLIKASHRNWKPTAET